MKGLRTRRFGPYVAVTTEGIFAKYEIDIGCLSVFLLARTGGVIAFRWWPSHMM